MQSVIQHVYSDSKGRAVAVMVLDCTVAALNARIAESPVAIDAYTLEQLRAVKQPAPVPPAGPVAQIPESESKPQGGPLSRWLGAQEKKDSFQAFLQKKYNRDVSNAKSAEITVKSVIGFNSRTQLDNDHQLSIKFKTEIMQEYGKWLNK